MVRKALFLISILVLASLSALSLPPDDLTGKWNASFQVVGITITGTMAFNVEGQLVTGSVETQHTGHGTISNGQWKDGQLSFTANFEKHESIMFTGKIKDGKLDGEFTTEGNTGKWTALRDKTS